MEKKKKMSRKIIDDVVKYNRNITKEGYDKYITLPAYMGEVKPLNNAIRLTKPDVKVENIDVNGLIVMGSMSRSNPEEKHTITVFDKQYVVPGDKYDIIRAIIAASIQTSEEISKGYSGAVKDWLNNNYSNGEEYTKLGYYCYQYAHKLLGQMLELDNTVDNTVDVIEHAGSILRGE